MNRYILTLIILTGFLCPGLAEADYYGSWKIDGTVTVMDNTHLVSTGNMQVASSAKFYVYEDLSETELLSGNLTVHDTGIFSGAYKVQLTLSSGNGFEKGKSYNVAFRATVGSITSATTHNFQIEAEVDANTVSPTVTFDNTTINTANNVTNGVPLADDAITPPKFNDAASNITYAGGIWIDDAASNTNTVVGVDGLPSNPVSTLVAARTIADAIGIKRYYITNDSTLTLAATHMNWEFVGVGLRNLLDLGSQNVNDSHFFNLVLSGIQGGTQKIQADTCYLNGITNLNIVAHNGWLIGDNTLSSTSQNIFDHCSSNVPGGSTPELTFPAGITTVGFRHYSGGLQVNNMTSDHTMSYEGMGQLVVDATCTSGNINIRGLFKVTDNGTTTQLVQEAVYNRTYITAIEEHIINTGNVDWPTATGFSTKANVNEIIESNRLNELVAVTRGGVMPVAGSIFDDTWSKDNSQTYSATTDSLEAISNSGGGGPTAPQIADAVWNEAIADHTVTTQFGGKNQKAVPSETINDYKATGFAVAGDEMKLEDGAIASGKYDQSSAFPVESADSGATQIARTGADGDTLETLSDQIDLAALEASLNDIKGGGWSTENLVTIEAAINALQNLSAAGVWAHKISDDVIYTQAGGKLNLIRP